MPSHADLMGKPDLTIKDATKELKQTHVTGYLTRPHAKDESLLWCATMQIAWDGMAGYMKAPFRLSGTPEPVMSAEMNRMPWKKGELDDASFLAMAGMGPETVRAIKAELERKFKGAASPSVLPTESSLAPTDILAYAYLFKNLQFEHPFMKRDDGLPFATSDGKSTMVKAFRLDPRMENWAAVAGQVTVKHYAAPDDFVIEIATKEKDDRLIIARMTPGATLRETVDAAMARVNEAAKESPAPLTREEPFEVPIMNFDVTRDFGEIVGMQVATPGFTDLIVLKALQNIRFKLDERGAILKSDAAIVVGRTAARPPVQRRSFVCEGPFLVLMARREATTPYFAAWIANDELLVKQGS